jgi:hypothetical protein
MHGFTFALESIAACHARTTRADRLLQVDRSFPPAVGTLGLRDQRTTHLREEA